MKKSLKERIYRFLLTHGQWVHKGIIARKAEDAGYLAENAGRRLRELVNDGLIERRLNSKGHVEYKINIVDIVFDQQSYGKDVVIDGRKKMARS